MKLVIAIASAAALAAFNVQAQTADATSTSGANSGSTSQVGSNVQSSGTGNSAAQAATRSDANAGALGNVTNVMQDFSTPSRQTINTNSTGSQTVTTIGNSVSTGTLQNNTDYSGSYTIRNVPNMVAPTIGVSAPCKVALSGSVAVAGFGVAAGGSLNDEECQLREDVRVLAQMGFNDGALSLMCSKPQIAAAMPTQCQSAQAKSGAIAPVSTPKKAEYEPKIPANYSGDVRVRDPLNPEIAPAEIVSLKDMVPSGGRVTARDGTVWERKGDHFWPTTWKQQLARR